MLSLLLASFLVPCALARLDSLALPVLKEDAVTMGTFKPTATLPAESTVYTLPVYIALSATQVAYRPYTSSSAPANAAPSNFYGMSSVTPSPGPTITTYLSYGPTQFGAQWYADGPSSLAAATLSISHSCSWGNELSSTTVTASSTPSTIVGYAAQCGASTTTWYGRTNMATATSTYQTIVAAATYDAKQKMMVMGAALAPSATATVQSAASGPLSGAGWLKPLVVASIVVLFMLL